MDYRKLGAVMLSATLLAGGAATVSLAQQPPRSEAQRGETRQRMSPEQRAERRAEHLRTVLQLRPEQEPALRTFLSASQRSPGDRGKMRGQRQEMAQMTTPQRLDRMAERMRERQARFEQHAAATKRFYAQLSPAQQKAFDAIGPRGRMKGGEHRGGHGGGPDGDRGHGQRG